MKTSTIIKTIALLVFSISFFSCTQKQEETFPSGDVEFYLLESYETISGTFQIDESTIVLEEQALISYDDLLSYYPSLYAFSLTETAKTKIKELEHSVHGIAFAVVVDEKLLYSAYFWPSYSSMSCDWVVTDPTGLDIYNQLRIQIGYPGSSKGVYVPDRRNDDKLVGIFKRDGKLIQ